MEELEWDEFDSEAAEAFYNSEEFKSGLDIGHSIGESDFYDRTKKMYDQGAIDFWIAWMEPKSLEDWDAFHKKYGSDKELRKKYGLPDR